MIGSMVGQYRVEKKIGEGGMGQVYRARDAKLDRDVALKVLPSVDTSKPAISGMAAETGGVLPRGLRGAQVGLDLRAPAAWPALEDMAMMQQAIQQGGDGRGVAE